MALLEYTHGSGIYHNSWIFRFARALPNLLLTYTCIVNIIWHVFDMNENVTVTQKYQIVLWLN